MAMSLAGSRSRRRGRGSRAPMVDINVTPFVDVMLVLLIIFMVTAPLLKAAVPIELPDSRAKAMSEDPEQIELTIRRDGAVFLDNSPLAPGELTDRLENYRPDAEGRLPLVILRADKGLGYGEVMGVMGELNRAGFTSISLVTGVTTVAPGAPLALSGGSDAGQ